MKDTGYITVALKGTSGKTAKGANQPKVAQRKVQVFLRFQYLGHSFIVHQPRTEKVTGFVCSHEGLGFLVSETGTSVKTGQPVKDPNQYISPEVAKEVAIHNIDNFIQNGGDLDAVVNNYKPLIVKTVGYLELVLRKIL